MKAEVVKRFKDKYTEEVYKAGALIEVTEERYKEILEKGDFVKKVEDEETEPSGEGGAEKTKAAKKKKAKKEAE